LAQFSIPRARKRPGHEAIVMKATSRNPAFDAAGLKRHFPGLKDPQL
jgi:hypothetical protein